MSAISLLCFLSIGPGMEQLCGIFLSLRLYFWKLFLVSQTNEIQYLYWKNFIACHYENCLTFLQDKHKMHVLDSPSPPFAESIQSLPASPYWLSVVRWRYKQIFWHRLVSTFYSNEGFAERTSRAEPLLWAWGLYGPVYDGKSKKNHRKTHTDRTWISYKTCEMKQLVDRSLSKTN